MTPNRIPASTRKPSPARKGNIPLIMILKKRVPQEQTVTRNFIRTMVCAESVTMRVP